MWWTLAYQILVAILSHGDLLFLYFVGLRLFLFINMTNVGHVEVSVFLYCLYMRIHFEGQFFVMLLQI